MLANLVLRTAATLVLLLLTPTAIAAPGAAEENSATLIDARAAQKTPSPPGLAYLYTVNIVAGNLTDLGTGPHGTRFAVPILGGSFAGPRLRGKLLPLGGDWGLVDSNGVVYPDVRQTFQTDDGETFQVWETGVSQADGTAHVRLTFETGSQRYYWLNGVVGVGVLKRLSDTQISIDAWQLTAPKP